MAFYRRRRFTKRRYGGRKSYSGRRKRYGGRRLGKTISLSTGAVTSGAVQGSVAGLPVFYGMAFTLNAFSNTTAYQSLFDLYRIDKVTVTLTPRYTEYPLDNAAGIANPAGGQIHYAVDRTDADTPLNINQVVEMEGSKSAPWNKRIVVSWKPKVAMAIYNSSTGVASNYGISTSKQWMEMQYPSIPHYGLKIAVDPVPGAGAGGLVPVWDMRTDLKLSFKWQR